MSAELRSLCPDWHRYRIAWRIQVESNVVYIGLSANGPVDVRLATDSKVGLLYAHKTEREIEREEHGHV